MCIIGDVGSGKSSLLNAIIGDLLYLDSDFINDHKDDLVSNDVVISTVKMEGQRKMSEAPITVSESIAYVQ